jgi:hypothetical protein
MTDFSPTERMTVAMTCPTAALGLGILLSFWRLLTEWSNEAC